VERIKKKLKNGRFLRKFIPISVLALAVVALAIYQLLIVPRQSKETYIYKATTVQRGDIVLGIEESGTVTLTTSELDYDLIIDADEDEDDDDDDEEDENTKNLEIEEVYVSQGQRITEGEALFKLTDSSVASVKRLLQSNQEDEKIALAEAKEEYDIGGLQADNTKKETSVTYADA
jgi:HlyD family secretion protein